MLNPLVETTTTVCGTPPAGGSSPSTFRVSASSSGLGASPPTSDRVGGTYIRPERQQPIDTGTERTDGAIERRIRRRGDRDARTLREQRARDCQPDASRASGDERDLTVER